MSAEMKAPAGQPPQTGRIVYTSALENFLREGVAVTTLDDREMSDEMEAISTLLAGEDVLFLKLTPAGKAEVQGLPLIVPTAEWEAFVAERSPTETKSDVLREMSDKPSII